MREIKFRGKRISDSKWNFGVPYRSEGTWWMLVDDNTRTQEIGTGSYQIIPETVGQFTGHISKDGKEIYDSDICVSLDGRFLIVWNEEKAAFEMVFQDGERLYLEEMWDDTKVIGNLHDNLDLWEVV